MCKVKTAREMNKRVVCRTKDGGIFYSGYFQEPGGQVSYEEAINENIRKTMDDHCLCEDDIEEIEIEKLKEDDHIYLSRHALKRLKKRNGWNKKTSERMLKKIYEEGKQGDEIKGSVASWIEHKEKIRSGNAAYILYGEKAYVFDGQLLVTVLNTPRKRSYFNPAYKTEDNEYRKEICKWA